MKRLVSWTLRRAKPQGEESDGYNIDKFRNPDNALIDSENCPEQGNDASMVPLTDE